MKIVGTKNKLSVDGVEIKDFNEAEITPKEPVEFEMTKRWDVSLTADSTAFALAMDTAYDNFKTILADTIKAECISLSEPVGRFIITNDMRATEQYILTELLWERAQHNTFVDPDDNEYKLISVCNLERLRGYNMYDIITHERSILSYHTIRLVNDELEWIRQTRDAYMIRDIEDIIYPLEDLMAKFAKIFGGTFKKNGDSYIYEDASYKIEICEEYMVAFCRSGILKYNTFGHSVMDYRQYQYADIIYYKKQKRFSKHRGLGEQKANEILNFTSTEEK